MNYKAVILGSFFFQCVLCLLAGSECPFYPDPNDYVDNPSTLENSSFECGDPNNHTPYGTPYAFIPPLYWERIPEPDSNSECYASLHSSFKPLGVSWEIAAPYEGNFFVLLSNQDVDSSEDNLTTSTIQQKVNLSEGDVILGAYYFGTLDWPEYNDYCRIYAKLDPNYIPPSSEPNEINLVTNGGFDSDIAWIKTGLWTITDPNIIDPNIVDPNIVDPNTADPNKANCNAYLLPPEISTLSQSISLIPYENYLVSIDILKGSFNSGSDAFSVTLGDETYTMTVAPTTTISRQFTPTDGNMLIITWDNPGTISIDNVSVIHTPDECIQYPVEEFTIIYKSVGYEPNEIPKFQSTGGWIPFEYTVEPNQTGSYFLRCEVADIGDTIYNSYLGVDGLRICAGGHSQTDLNHDCNVNIEDFSILTEAWLAFCPDPPFYDPNLYNPDDYPVPSDPNIPCQLADIDNSWFVDANDLMLMSNDWLYIADPNTM